MKRSFFRLSFIILCAVIFMANNCPADEGTQAVLEEKGRQQELALQKEEKETHILSGIEILSGYAWSKLKAKSDAELKRDYNFYPIIVDFGFNLKNLTKKIGIDPPGVLEFQLEPYLAYVSSPNANAEIGNSFMLKLGLLPEDWKIQLYAKAGLGMVYMTNHTPEQSTQFNFIESGGLGAHYFFTKNMAFTMEGRMRHLSNAGIKQPNHGINTYFALAGISYKY